MDAGSSAEAGCASGSPAGGSSPTARLSPAPCPLPPFALPAPPAPACPRSNEQVVSTCNTMSAKGATCQAIAAELSKMAVAAGSTDDITVLLVKLK